METDSVLEAGVPTRVRELCWEFEVGARTDRSTQMTLLVIVVRELIMVRSETLVRRFRASRSVGYVRSWRTIRRSIPSLVSRHIVCRRFITNKSLCLQNTVARRISKLGSGVGLLKECRTSKISTSVFLDSIDRSGAQLRIYR